MRNTKIVYGALTAVLLGGAVVGCTDTATPPQVPPTPVSDGATLEPTPGPVVLGPEVPSWMTPTPTPVGYTCDNIRVEVTDVASEQHTEGSLLVGIKKAQTVKDIQESATNGWVLKCTGVGIFSGGRENTPIVYGVKIEGGETYVVVTGRDA